VNSEEQVSDSSQLADGPISGSLSFLQVPICHTRFIGILSMLRAKVSEMGMLNHPQAIVVLIVLWTYFITIKEDLCKIRTRIRERLPHETCHSGSANSAASGSVKNTKRLILCLNRPR
jgi:hypothetical protein